LPPLFINGVRLLRNAKVAAAIDIAMVERSARIEITQDRVARELTKIAFFDIREALTTTVQSSRFPNSMATRLLKLGSRHFQRQSSFGLFLAMI
jgi:hypothetical protein